MRGLAINRDALWWANVGGYIGNTNPALPTGTVSSVSAQIINMHSGYCTMGIWVQNATSMWSTEVYVTAAYDLYQSFWTGTAWDSFAVTSYLTGSASVPSGGFFGVTGRVLDTTGMAFLYLTNAAGTAVYTFEQRTMAWVNVPAQGLLLQAFTAPANVKWRGLHYFPTPGPTPSATPTASTSSTSSLTATPTTTATATASISVGTSPSATATPASSVTASPSVTPSPSRSASTTRTPTVTPTPTGTAGLPFATGSLVVLRFGTGAAALTAATAPAFLDEFTEAGVALSTTALPSSLISFSGNGGVQQASGSRTDQTGSEGLLQPSTDGTLLSLVGPDSLGLGATAGTSTTGRVAIINASRGVDVSTRITTGANDAWSSALINGNSVYATSKSGLQYTTVGSASSTQICA